MLNASFCGVDEINGGQAVKLQDRNMTLHGNPITEIYWNANVLLKKIPAWLRTLEKITYANLEHCDVNEMQGGAFPASLEELRINYQGSGLRLHPDSFEGMSNLTYLEASTNNITEDDMHPGLFAGATSLRTIEFYSNTEMRRFNATELFPGGSKTVWYINLDSCGLVEGTSFQGLPYLKKVDLRNCFLVLPPRLFSGFCALRPDRLDLNGTESWSDDTFAGTTLCDAIRNNDAAKQACEEQADADSESVCGCQVGTCSSCESEDSCGSHSWCAWEADDGALGGSCSDPLIAPTDMTFFECAHFCSYEVEGGRIPCVASMEDNNELWGRSQGLDQNYVWNGNFLSGEEWERVDETCRSDSEYWKPGYPNGGGRCSSIRHVWYGEWFDERCTSMRSCVCQPATEPSEIDFNRLGGEIYGCQPNDKKDGCENCESGKYSNGWECKSCGAGRFSTAVGSSSVSDCQLCEAGEASAAGSSTCRACSMGRPNDDNSDCVTECVVSSDTEGCLCDVGSETAMLTPSGVVPDTTGIRLQTASGTPSFDSEGQVQGRLEVVLDGQWRTVEDWSGSSGGIVDSSIFGSQEATVACRQLGNELGYELVSASRVSGVETADGTGAVYEVTCTGEETTIESCSFREWDWPDWHEGDVGVSCAFLAPGNECEACVAGKYSDAIGVAACTNCAAGSSSSVLGSASADDCELCEAGKASAAPAATSAAACTECHAGKTSSEDRSECGCALGSGTVFETPSGAVPVTTGIRLQTASGTLSFDSEGNLQGRLEVFHDGQWGTVYDDGLEADAEDGQRKRQTFAEVSCRQLGAELGYVAASWSVVPSSQAGGETPPGIGKNWLCHLDCEGPEATLFDCGHTLEYPFWGDGDVYHDQDIGVSCTFLVALDECEECVLGKFSGTTGVAACEACEGGKTTAGPGATSLDECVAG
jgi:serine protease 12 (motopsin)